MNGFFKIERDFMASEFWLSEPFTKPQAWIDLIGMANYSQKTKYYKGAFQNVKRGQIVTSKAALANRWKWSKHKVHAYLLALERAAMITTEGTATGTVLTIVNYGLYQDAGNAQGTQKRSRRERSGNGEGTERDPQEEGKKNKEAPLMGSQAHPTAADVSAFCEACGLTVDAERFVDYYEATGWKIGGQPVENWQALCRRWNGTQNYKSDAPAKVDISAIALTEGFYDSE